MARGGTRKTTEKLLVIDGVEVLLRRKEVKNLSVRVRAPRQVIATAPFWMPEAEVASYLLSKWDWILSKREELSQMPSARAEMASEAEKRAWKQVVQACVPPLVEEWERILGVEVKTLAYRNMKSRWGSCQPATGRVCINTRLALYPPECLEYVVVHELCHLLEANHGPGFHALMDRVMPDWKERSDKLR